MDRLRSLTFISSSSTRLSSSVKRQGWTIARSGISSPISGKFKLKCLVNCNEKLVTYVVLLYINVREKQFDLNHDFVAMKKFDELDRMYLICQSTFST